MHRSGTLFLDDGATASSVAIEDLRSHPSRLDDVLTAGRRAAVIPVSALMSTSLDWVTVASADESYSASIPAATLLAHGRLLIGTQDDPLPAAEGGPLRLVVEDGRTLCWNVKGVGSLIATADKQPDSVPENPPH